MVETFIRRPVLSLVISLFITLLGILALFNLPVTQFPDIVPPSVVVTANYNGANAEVCANAVATPLERAINGVPGMTYMNSVSSNNGMTLIQVFFDVGTDPDQAAVNVQNRVSTVLDELPEEVIKAGVITEKEVNSMLLYLNLFSSDSTESEEFIYNYADINILPELKRIEGVGFVEIMGARDYSMRVWLRPDRMLALNISTEEIIEALRQQNVEAAPGVSGENSGKGDQVKQYVLRYPGKFSTPEEYKNLVLRAGDDGTVLKLGDIADIEFGTVSYDMVSKTDGRASASIMVKQRPGSNAREVIENIKAKMAELQSTSFPPGIQLNYAYDVSRFLDASINEVLKTLVEAFILVFIVVFLFLQDFRSTLIPALAVPVALIGTLAFMMLLGFSINMLTLFALVLAIGIVVDNAIIVVEAVHVKMAQEKLPPLEATIAAMKEITGATIAITLVMSAVFIPVAFLSGPVGVFYRQFSLTLAISIIISGVNALTLTPALCALLLKHDHSPRRKKSLLQKFYGSFNRVYDKTERNYGRAISWMAGRRLVTIAMFLFFVVGTWGISSVLPTGFIPTEDQGMIYVNVTTPPGATVERTEKVLDEVEDIAARIGSVENISTLAGFSLMSDITGASYGMAMINLKSWDERKESVPELISYLEEQTAGISDASIEFFAPPTVPGFGNASGFEFRILDRNRGSELANTDKVTQEFLEELRKKEPIGLAFTSFDPNFPQYMIHVDQEMAAKKGVTIDRAMSTLQTLLGSYYATNFIRFGQMYKVMLQAYPEYRRNPEDILALYVKNKDGEMVPYSTFIRLERVFGPEQITRYNMYTSAMINGESASGFSSSDAIAAIRETAEEKLPRGFDYEWSGMTREEILSGNQAVFVFIISLVFVYLVLAAQYESFLLPLPVILSLPTGIFGSMLFLKLAGLENNIYAQVALVMLIGLLGKNAILIVEFAIQRRKEGMSIIEAARKGSTSRLRPILMTSFAFIAGLIPLTIATGAGAMGNRSIGMASAGGMLTGTIFGILLIPGLYVLFARMAERKKKATVKATPSRKQQTVMMILVILLFGAGCAVPKVAELPSSQNIPSSFTQEQGIGMDKDSTARVLETGTDSSGIAREGHATFFRDPYLVAMIDSALQNNPDMFIALQRIEQAKAMVQMSRGALKPAVSGVVSAGVDRFGDYTMNGVGNFDTNLSTNIDKDQRIPYKLTPDLFAGLRSTWELDIWKKFRNRKEAAINRLLASEQGRHLVKSTMVSEIASGYYELLALDSELKILRKNIELQERAAEIIKVQKEGGRATELAVQQFQAQVLNTKAAEMDILRRITEVENRLNYVMGKYPGPVARDTGFLSRPLETAIAKGTTTAMLIRRPDIRQAEMELAATRADVQAARAAFLPSLNLTAYIGLNAFRPELLINPGSFASGILAGLSAPILNRSQIRAEFDLANAQSLEAYYNYQKAIRKSFAEVTTNLEALHYYTRAYTLKEQEVNVLTNAAGIAQDLYLAGYANYLEVIAAQKGILEAELSLMENRRAQFESLVNLYVSLGGGWQ